MPWRIVGRTFNHFFFLYFLKFIMWVIDFLSRIFSGASKGQKNTQWISPRSQLAICSGPISFIFVGLLLFVYFPLVISIQILHYNHASIFFIRSNMHPTSGCDRLDCLATLRHPHHLYVSTRRASKVMKYIWPIQKQWQSDEEILQGRVIQQKTFLQCRGNLWSFDFFHNNVPGNHFNILFPPSIF